MDLTSNNSDVVGGIILASIFLFGVALGFFRSPWARKDFRLNIEEKELRVKKLRMEVDQLEKTK